LDPNRTHRGIEPTECEFFYIHFSIENGDRYQEIDDEIILPYIMEAKKNSQMILPKYYHVESTEGLLRCNEKIEKILTTFLAHDFYKELQVATYLYELMIVLATEYAKGVYHSKTEVGGKVRSVLQELLEYLQREYAQDISGDMLQERFHYHFDYLNRQFKKWTGQTIFSYLQRLRIERANQLLLTGFYTIAEVAVLTGFRDVYYFSRVLKKMTGNTPGEIRNSVLVVERQDY